MKDDKDLLDKKFKQLKEDNIINDYKIEDNILYLSPKQSIDHIDIKIEIGMESKGGK